MRQNSFTEARPRSPWPPVMWTAALGARAALSKRYTAIHIELDTTQHHSVYLLFPHPRMSVVQRVA